VFAKWLKEELKLNAFEIETLFEGEGIESETTENLPEATES
jgi:hypothetical protein